MKPVLDQAFSASQSASQSVLALGAEARRLVLRREFMRAAFAAAAVAAVPRLAFGQASAPAVAAKAGADPLPSWNDGACKRAILTFVADVTRKGGPKFVSPVDRVATFDND